MKIVIIIPTYNERTNIAKLIPLLEKEIFPRIKSHDMYVLVVDDKSPDGTAEEVTVFMKQWKNIQLLSGDKNGLGAAYVRGMKYAMEKMQADAVMEFDADFQHDPNDIPKLITALDDGADYVIGSRYIEGGSIPKEWGLDRKILSIFGNWFTRVVWRNFTIHDMTSGFKLTKTSFLKKIDLDNLLSNHFAYKMQILHDAVKYGAKVKEVPIVFLEREKGTSKISKKDQFESFYVVLRLGTYPYKRFIKFMVVGGTGFFLQFLTVYIAIHFGSEQFIAAMIGGETAILSNFVLNNVWTFGDTKSIKQQGSFFKRLVKFNLASLGSIAIQGVVTYFAVAALGEQMNVLGLTVPTSMIILIPTIILLVIPLNYFIYNKVIWKTQYLQKPKADHAKTS
ncbi:MAG: glycosyltransferase family 2 protein [Candidatus Levybacteria bacterium]|nr:glycosyltransferase family 2 protein [Candidatus Levybacteria bacterium]